MNMAVQHAIDLDSNFLAAVLRPYRQHCRYLKRATILFDSSSSTMAWQSMTSRGEFSIDQSCYIDDTGHFNAVEFNICYNQLAYVHLAYCIQQHLMPALAAYDLATFYEKQLSNYLIGNISSHYRAQINPRNFFGEVKVSSARSRPKLSILNTECTFSDESGGSSYGEVKLAVLSP